VLAYIELKLTQGKKSVDTMPNNLDGTHLCLNVFFADCHLAVVTYPLIQRIS